MCGAFVPPFSVSNWLIKLALLAEDVKAYIQTKSPFGSVVLPTSSIPPAEPECWEAEYSVSVHSKSTEPSKFNI